MEKRLHGGNFVAGDGERKGGEEMLYQPSNISPDEINGTGCVDIREGITVSWQVNGDSAMTAYQIEICQNDTASTPVYSTGRINLSVPFWGVNYKGDTQYYSAKIAAAALSGAGMTNGEEYKLLIRQWWSDNDYTEQTTASVFITRTAPTVRMDLIESPLESKAASFTATYTQAQGDAIKWARWQIAEANQTEEPFVDTGKISGTGELRVDYDGFFPGTEYAIRCSIETANGIGADTGWVSFPVEYAVGEAQGQVSACQLENDSAVFISWEQMEVAQGYSILRQRSGDKVLRKIAEVDATTGQLRDYSARSGERYTYYVFPSGTLAYLTEPMISGEVNVQFWLWSIIEAREQEDGSYSAVAAHLFRYGSGGVQEGSFSNNNSPQLNKNFTKYPTRQAESANYLTGSVSGYIGTVNKSTAEYADRIDQSDKLFSLSTSENALFLLDPKGHFLRIHTAEPVSLSINHKSPVMPQTITIAWAETGSADEVSVISAPGGDFYPTDEIIATTISIDVKTGRLIWTTPENYGDGSTLALNSDGALVQTAEGSYTVASLGLDESTGILTATI